MLLKVNESDTKIIQLKLEIDGLKVIFKDKEVESDQDDDDGSGNEEPLVKNVQKAFSPSYNEILVIFNQIKIFVHQYKRYQSNHQRLKRSDKSDLFPILRKTKNIFSDVESLIDFSAIVIQRLNSIISFIDGEHNQNISFKPLESRQYENITVESGDNLEIQDIHLFEQIKGLFHGFVTNNSYILNLISICFSILSLILNLIFILRKSYSCSCNITKNHRSKKDYVQCKNPKRKYRDNSLDACDRVT